MSLNVGIVNHNSVANIQKNKYNSSFRANQAISFRSESNNDDKKSGVGGKIVLGTVVVLGLLTAADFIFAKGKHFKKIFKIGSKEAENKVTHAGTKDIVTLKDSGVKIEKGKALDAEGNLFSGKFLKESKQCDGRTRKNVLEFKEGKLQNVETYAADIWVDTKTYNYGENGKIKSIVKKPFLMDAPETEYVKTFEYYDNGKIKSVIDTQKIIDKPFEKHFNYDDDWKLKSIENKIFKAGENKEIAELVEIK